MIAKLKRKDRKGLIFSLLFLRTLRLPLRSLREIIYRYGVGLEKHDSSIDSRIS